MPNLSRIQEEEEDNQLEEEDHQEEDRQEEEEDHQEEEEDPQLEALLQAAHPLWGLTSKPQPQQETLN